MQRWIESNMSQRKSGDKGTSASLNQRIPVNRAALAPFNSYGVPDFVTRGFYQDEAFTCRQCGSENIWLAKQQHWWFEIAKGYVYSTAILCRACRILRKSV